MSNKRIIVCCDGTWNDLRMRYITNVGRLLQCLLPVDETGTVPLPQVAYYDDGVGADAEGFRRVLEGGIGKGLDNLVYEAYRFICLNYQPGDELFLFGFSRGAYTARSVAGLLGAVGVVPRSRLKDIPEAMAVYRARSGEAALQQAFRKRVKPLNATVDFLGCWDTVGALGIPDKTALFTLDRLARARYQFHDTTLGRHIRRAAHAVAIDERRKEFAPTLMHCAPGARTRLRECWFPGDHGAVGGGTWEKRGLSNAALTWMLHSAAALGAPLATDLERLHDRARSDHTVYFNAAHGLLYTDEARSLKKHKVPWAAIHLSARDRWRDEPSYRPRNLSAAHGKALRKLEPALGPATAGAAAAAPARRAPAGKAPLRLRVSAEEPGTATGVHLSAGKRYRLAIAPLQVWQDGPLDPCDARGWNTLAEPAAGKGAGREPKLPWQDGEQISGGLLKGLVRSSRHRALVPEADWFELVAALGDGPFRRLNPPPPKTPCDDIVVTFTAWADGELRLAANDIESRWRFLDRYGNNRGWLWVSLSPADGR